MASTHTHTLPTGNRKTYYSLSLYRVIGIFCILFSHFIWLVVAKDVPFGQLLSEPRCGFMVLSGLLYSQRPVNDVKGFYFKNYKKLLLPLVEVLLFLLLWNVIYMAVYNNWDFLAVWQGQVRSAPDQTVFQISNWYYVAWVAVCYFLTPFLDRWDKKWWCKMIIIITLVANLAVCAFWKTDIKLLYPCYLVGYFVGKKKWDQYLNPKNKNNIWSIVFWLSITAFAVVVFCATVFMMPLDSAEPILFIREVMRVFSGAAFGVGTFFVFILITNLFMFNVESCKFLLWTDKVCYIIYLMNQCFAVGGTDTTGWVPDGMPYTDGLRCLIFTAMTIAGALFIFYCDFGVKRLIRTIKNKKLAQPS